MTKAELVREISARTGLESYAALRCVESMMEVVKETMAKGESVYLRGFGTFAVKRRAPKLARDISKGMPLAVPARLLPAFKPAPAFKDLLNE